VTHPNLEVVNWVHVLWVGGGGPKRKVYGITVKDNNWTEMHPTKQVFDINDFTLLRLTSDGMFLKNEDLERARRELAELGVSYDGGMEYK